MCEHAQAFAIHADRRDFGAWHHLRATFGGGREFGGGDRFDFRHDDVRLDFVEQRAQLVRVGHVEHAVFVRHLLCRRTGVGIGRAHPCAESHQFDGDFLAQLAGAKEQNTGRMLAKRSAEGTILFSHDFYCAIGVGWNACPRMRRMKRTPP